MRTILFLSLLISLRAYAVDCPLGPKDDHLTLARVMRNFGRFVSDADAVAVQSKDAANPVSDTQMTTAADKLVLAVACAQAVLDHPDGDLLPGKVADLQGDARTQYVAKFVAFMTEFRDGLKTYHDMLAQLQATPAAQRNFDAFYVQYKTMDDLANRAHKELGGGSHFFSAMAVGCPVVLK